VPKALALAGPNDVDYRHLRQDFPGRIQAGEGVPDAEWLQLVGECGWLALSQDTAILRNAAALDALREFRAGVVFLRPGDAPNHEVLAFILRRMPWLRQINAEDERPFAYTASLSLRGRARRFDLHP